MNTTRLSTIDLMIAAILLGLGGCAGMSKQGQNTAIGAGVGAVGGALPSSMKTRLRSSWRPSSSCSGSCSKNMALPA